MEDHREEVRRKILNSAKKLFVQQGYEKTTIRQIEADSGVLIGSIYYMFRNKEDIFQELIASLVKNVQAKIESVCANETPIFKYAAVCEVELRKVAADSVICDTFFHCYTSKIIFENMVIQFAGLAARLFSGTKYECFRDEYYQKSLLIKGAMYSCIAEMYFKTYVSTTKSRESLIRLALSAFNVPVGEIDRTIKRLNKKEKLWIKLGNELAEQPI